MHNIFCWKPSPVIFSHSSELSGLDFMQFKTTTVPIVLAYIIVWTLLRLYRLFFVFYEGKVLHKMLYADGVIQQG